ncbi:hypothetical protein HPB48_006904 [Haemaphysalis longicornis]|uniref:Uncharacterized protein n=1 Tax=Haemaphysalis longicornis TaxID=44386 RepID=A0A9J6F775_HAELO|nr:hypothetical protein HPB48_006904 [Haemaphysalis longicornis]
MFGVESRSQQFLYLSSMTFGINDLHFIFSALLSEADSTFLPSSIYVSWHTQCPSSYFVISNITCAIRKM